MVKDFKDPSKSKYFDLDNNDRVSIASIPKPYNDLSTLLLYHEIVIAGCTMIIESPVNIRGLKKKDEFPNLIIPSMKSSNPGFVYSYHIIKNKYKKMNPSLTEKNYNSLFQFEHMIYLLNGPNIYMCDDLDDKNNWVLVQRMENYNYKLSKPCYYRKFAYCHDKSNNIYRFDFENLTLTFIENLF